MNDADLHKISTEDHQKISETIKRVEKKTSGEVYAVVSHASDDYFYVAGFVAALWSLGAALAILLVTWWFYVEIPAAYLVAAQVVSLIVTLFIFRQVPSLRMVFVPQRIAFRRASNNAKRQFLAHGIHGTTHRSGILLFVSIAEHYAEVVADAGINEKVGQQGWDDIVTLLTSNAKQGELAKGFVQAIDASGALLASHFPPEDKPHNDLDDRLVEI